MDVELENFAKYGVLITKSNSTNPTLNFNSIGAKKIVGEDGLGIKVNRYYASEINEDSIKVTMDNYPNTIQLGDVASLIELNDDGDVIRVGDKLNYWRESDMPSVTLHIERLGHENALTEEQRTHPSETALNDYEFNYYIKCITGLEYLEKEVITFLNWLINEREQF